MFVAAYFVHHGQPGPDKTPEEALACHREFAEYDYMIWLMQSIHFTCFLFLVLPLFWSYLPRVMLLMVSHLPFFTLPIYQGGILYLFEFMTRSDVCADQLGSMHQFLDLEIIQFYFYMALTPWVLVKSRIINIGLVQNQYVTQEDVANFLQVIYDRIEKELGQGKSSIVIQKSNHQDISVYPTHLYSQNHNSERTLEALNLQDPLDRQIQVDQVNHKFGWQRINFQGISPYIWLYEWFGISIKEFQNKRNHLYNHVDFFDNCPYLWQLIQMYEFQIVYSLYLLIQILSASENPPSDSLTVIIVVLFVLHLLVYGVSHYFLHRKKERSNYEQTPEFNEQIERIYDFNFRNYAEKVGESPMAAEGRPRARSRASSMHMSLSKRGEGDSDVAQRRAATVLDVTSRVVAAIFGLAVAIPIEDSGNELVQQQRFWVIVDSAIMLLTASMTRLIHKNIRQYDQKISYHVIHLLQQELHQNVELVKRVEKETITTQEALQPLEIPRLLLDKVKSTP